ncbi:MAG: NAD-dependent epimerase/dehydratase family protein, partial [Pararheinheimera sp.]|nr:NAD-dependent epimerase/dehydratase family protein [Rheinheimera sp.]
LAQLTSFGKFKFVEIDLADREGVARLFEEEQFQRVIHLGAQAGVRYSLENPMAYADSNLIGTLTILEGCRHHKIEHLVYASSSSVYGMNSKIPFSTTDRVDHQVSLYAATKKANELMAHSYSHLYSVPTTGLRFFTVYGPWGRPDMAPFLFTKAILADEPIKVFNHGNMMRDFTYVDDIVEGIIRVQDKIPVAQPQWCGSNGSESFAPYKIYNIGNNQPIKLMTFIEAIEKATGKSAIKEFHPMQDGDVPATFADIDDLQEAIGFKPATSIDVGMQKFVNWYRDYYKI